MASPQPAAVDVGTPTASLIPGMSAYSVVLVTTTVVAGGVVVAAPGSVPELPALSEPPPEQEARKAAEDAKTICFKFMVAMGRSLGAKTPADRALTPLARR